MGRTSDRQSNSSPPGARSHAPSNVAHRAEQPHPRATAGSILCGMVSLVGWIVGAAQRNDALQYASTVGFLVAIAGLAFALRLHHRWIIFGAIVFVTTAPVVLIVLDDASSSW